QSIGIMLALNSYKFRLVIVNEEPQFPQHSTTYLPEVLHKYHAAEPRAGAEISSHDIDLAEIFPRSAGPASGCTALIGRGECADKRDLYSSRAGVDFTRRIDMRPALGINHHPGPHLAARRDVAGPHRDLAGAARDVEHVSGLAEARVAPTQRAHEILARREA